jgi:hypothetical protein
MEISPSLVPLHVKKPFSERLYESNALEIIECCDNIQLHLVRFIKGCKRL